MRVDEARLWKDDIAQLPREMGLLGKRATKLVRYHAKPMTAANPATTHNELVTEINSYMDSDEHPSELALRRLKRRIEDLKRVAPAEGWLVSGMLSTYEWDGSATLLNIQNAIQFAPNDVDVLVTAGRCLWNLGQYDESDRLLSRARSIAPNHGRALDFAVYGMIAFARFHEAMKLKSKAKSMGVEIHPKLPEMELLESQLEQAGVTAERLQTEAALAMSVLAKHHVRLRTVQLHPWFDPDDGALHISLIYAFHGTVQQELELEKAMAVQLADDIHWDTSRLSTEFEAQAYPQ